MWKSKEGEGAVEGWEEQIQKKRREREAGQE